ncbi:MAG: hypothetical protein PHC85_01555 [Candidatus Pacebacteria bacterium]|nr:hypothetical protein [Candidatus Paceibacterota bacterium]
MGRNIKILGVNILTVFFLMFPLLAGAAKIVPCGGAGQPACDFCKFAELAGNLVKFLAFNIVLPLSVLSFAAAGIIFMTGGDNSSQIEKGKNIFKFTATGIVIAFAAYAVINTILGFLLDPGFSLYKSWNQFPSCSL